MADKKKQDGRKNNGGARPGAGRPRNEVIQIYDEDRLLVDRELRTKKVYSIRRDGYQARRRLKTRFDMMLETYAKDGKFLRKGYKKDFKEFVELALDTPDEEIYDYRKSRLEYVINQAKKAEQERLLKKNLPPKVLKPYEIALEEAAKARAELREIQRRQEAGNARAMDRHARDIEAYEKMRGRKWTGGLP